MSEITTNFAKEIIGLAALKRLSVQELRDAAEIAKRMSNHSFVEAGRVEQYKPERPMHYVDITSTMP